MIEYIKESVSKDWCERFNIREHPPMRGPYTTDQTPEAKYKNGTRVMKARAFEPDGGTHPIGAQATVLGSIVHPVVDTVGYFVKFDRDPNTAMFIVEEKLELVQ